jgi:hypothetical protein
MLESCQKFPNDAYCYGTQPSCTNGTFDPDICTPDRP